MTVAARVQRYREHLRSAGLRPVQIWVPDTRRPGFAAECVRQSLRAAQADAEDAELMEFLETALEDVDGWRE